MEPVILFIALGAILSGTIIKVKKLNLERERMRMGMGVGIGQAPVNTKEHDALMSKMLGKPVSTPQLEDRVALEKRLENLETIVLDDARTHQVLTDNTRLQQEVQELRNRIKRLEESKSVPTA